MNNFLYKNFLDDKLVYKKNQAFWDNLIKRLLESGNYSFVEYIATSDGYGNDFYDGNPIYNFMIEVLNKGVRIIQEAPGENLNQFTAWINETELPSGNKLDELVINMQLTQETIFLSIDLIHAWILSDLTKFRMKRYIETIGNLRKQIEETGELEYV